jgi:prepilin-type N-terminal cleavage/methylation domain-containing protein
MRNKNSLGFSLIELMVVISIIGFLASIVLIALAGGRQKARDTKRLGDMTETVKALELFFLSNRGYPDAVISGGTQVPNGLVPGFMATLPISPNPADGTCSSAIAPSPASPANRYYYQPQGTSYVVNGVTVFPSYRYYFCLGKRTGNFAPGLHYISPTGVQ